MFPRASTPEELPALFVEAWNKRDAEALPSLFEEEAEFVNVVGIWWHTREEIQRAHQYGLTVIFQDSDLKLQKTKITELGSDVVLVHAKMRLTKQSPEAGIAKPLPRQNIMSFIAIRKEGFWSCKSAHNTDVVPGVETNIVDEQGKMKSVSYR
ncbi:MAG: SgcJ/EcaC family oxidoreductase [Bacteroidota bacterium]